MPLCPKGESGMGKILVLAAALAVAPESAYAAAGPDGAALSWLWAVPFAGLFSPRPIAGVGRRAVCVLRVDCLLCAGWRHREGPADAGAD